jgi:hypothetical protein
MEHGNLIISMSAGAAVDATPTGPPDWEANREKILSLYADHSVKQIKNIMGQQYSFFSR